MTDSKGHFEISAFDGTAYRIHAVTMGRFNNETVSAELMPLGPGTDLSKPPQLILTRKGHSAAELIGTERRHRRVVTPFPLRQLRFPGTPTGRSSPAPLLCKREDPSASECTRLLLA